MYVDVLATLDPTTENVSFPHKDLLEIFKSGMSYTKSLEDKLSLEIDQDASSFEKLLLRFGVSNQLQKSQVLVESHQKPNNTTTATLENSMVDLHGTSIHQ